MNHGSAILALLGRVLLASIFVYSGFGKIIDFQGTAGYIASARLPMPQVLAVGSIIVEFIGGLALLIGFRARWAALAFIVFLIGATGGSDGTADQLHQEHRHHRRDADGDGVRPRPL
jgi:putative oxidoreductase